MARLTVQDMRSGIARSVEWFWDTFTDLFNSWWEKFTDKPIDAVMIVLVLFALGSFMTAKILKWTRPKSTLIVTSFDMPATPSAPLPVTGKAIADLLKDELNEILRSAQLKDWTADNSEEEGETRPQTKLQPKVTALLLGSVAAPSVPASSSPTLADSPQIAQVGLEVEGISLEKLFAVYDAIRDNQQQLLGNVLLYDPAQPGPPGCPPRTSPNAQTIVLRARIEGVREWITCPYPVDSSGLRNATRELASKVMSDFSPRTLGLAYLKTGHIEDSIRIFRQLAAHDPEDLAALQDLGFALYTASDLPAAIAQYRDVLTRNPEHPEQVHNNLGLAFYFNGQTEEAMSEYRRAIGLNGHYAAPHNNLGNALSDTDFDRARVEFEEAVRIDPADADAHDNLGRALDYQFHIKAALAEYRRAAHLRPGKAEFHGDLAFALERMNDFNGAMTEDLEALRLRPHESWTHSSLGSLFAELGQFDQALDEHQKALKIKNDVPEAHHNLGWTFELEGKYNDAIDEYSAALRVNPNYIPSRTNLARVLKRIDDSQSSAENGEYEAAIANYSDAISYSMNDSDAAVARREYANAFRDWDPSFAIDQLEDSLRNRKDPDTYNSLGYSHYLKHEYDQAISAYRQALQLRPEDIEARIGLGEVFEERAQRSEALSEYRQALANDASNPYVERHIASLLEAMTDYDGAARARRNAVTGFALLASRSPHNVDVLKNYGGTLSEAGDYAGALQQFDVALHEIPSDADARLGRGFALEGMGRDEEALADYRTATETREWAPAYLVYFYTNLGNLIDNQGNHSLAYDSYAQILQMFPEEPWTHMNIGLVDLETHDYARAMEEFDHALRVADFPEFHRAKCRLLLENDKPDYNSAMKECERALAFLPNDAFIHLLLGDILLAKSKHCRWCSPGSLAKSAGEHYREAVANGRKELKIRPDPEIEYELGRALLSAHQPGAIEELRNALQLRPKFPLADYWLAQALSQTGQPQDAAEAAREMTKARLADPFLPLLTLPAPAPTVTPTQ